MKQEKYLSQKVFCTIQEKSRNVLCHKWMSFFCFPISEFVCLEPTNDRVDTLAQIIKLMVIWVSPARFDNRLWFTGCLKFHCLLRQIENPEKILKNYYPALRTIDYDFKWWLLDCQLKLDNHSRWNTLVVWFCLLKDRTKVRLELLWENVRIKYLKANMQP